MRVFDLQCPAGHVFEGWFASEDAFVSQCERGLVSCPFCDSTDVKKMLSAPRLNLRSGATPERALRAEPVAPPLSPSAADGTTPQAVPTVDTPVLREMMKQWLEHSRRLAADTEDVGAKFAEQARQMHYGEREVRGIRGVASSTEVASLWEEGIEAIPLLLPAAAKQTLQ